MQETEEDAQVSKLVEQFRKGAKLYFEGREILGSKAKASISSFKRLKRSITWEAVAEMLSCPCSIATTWRSSLWQQTI
jgi:hypothetical protein